MSRIERADKRRQYTAWDGSHRESSGCMAYDMVANFIDQQRYFKKPLKSITLMPSLYDKIDDFGRKYHIKDEELRDESIEIRQFMYDGVPINRAKVLLPFGKQMIWDYHPMVITEEFSFENRLKPDFSALDTKLNDLQREPEVKRIITKL